VTKNPRQTEAVTDAMMKQAEELKCRPLPIVLMTELSTGAGLVRQIVAGLNEETKRLLEKKPEPEHYTLFVLADSEADNKRLMELH
jgi:hypothetical protein